MVCTNGGRESECCSIADNVKIGLDPVYLFIIRIRSDMRSSVFLNVPRLQEALSGRNCLCRPIRGGEGEFNTSDFKASHDDRFVLAKGTLQLALDH